MKHLARLFTFILAGISASATPPPTTRDEVLLAIAEFCLNPVSERGRASAEVITSFAYNRPDVEIKLTSKAIPWLSPTSRPKYAATLLTAFIAGNARSQLTSSVEKDDPVAGVEQVIDTYRQLQRSDPEFKLPEVENLIELQARGKLRAYLESPNPA